LESGEILVLPGAYDTLSAKLIERAGFSGVYMTGYGQSASKLGQPDVGLLTMSEMVERVRDLTMAVDVPVLCDGDTGFGNAANVIRTVREYERAGAAAIQLEDQVSPKKCGHMLGRRLIAMDEMVLKIKAAVAARTDPDFHLIVRTDARTSAGLDEAIKRAKAYEKAGADVIFIESLESVEEMKYINQEITKPTLANMVEGGRTPFLDAKTLESFGYNIVIYPVSTLYCAAKAVGEVLNELKSTGTTSGVSDKLIDFDEFNELIGLPFIQEIESDNFDSIKKKFPG
jgi:carboxyvinyl-carboxyphosphonate phosphorylmutase